MAFFGRIWKNNSKHQKLSEELALQNGKELESEEPDTIETENDVIIFKLKYCGSTVVEKIAGDSINTEAVKNIMKVTKAGRKKLQRVNLAISLKGIVVTDLDGNDLFKISIYRISNCSTDPTQRDIFSFISTDSNETMECHAFMCSKRKMAETVTLAVAHAFNTAYEAWKITPSPKDVAKSEVGLKENEKNKINQNQETFYRDDRVEEKLIDFDNEPMLDNAFLGFGKPPCEEASNTHWVCFDDDFVTDKRNTFKPDLIMA